MLKNPTLLVQYRIYFGGLFIALFSGILFLIFNGKEAGFVSPNSYHPFYLNVFFINYTFMGDGIFAVCLVGVMFLYFKRKQFGFALLYSFLISGIIVQIIKNFVNPFTSKLYFESGTYLNFINDVTLSGGPGFPSGHTATAFAIATVMVLMFKNKNLQLLILLAAIVVAYSRIYLAQHFLLDVMAGALLGSASGILGFYLAQNRINIKRTIKKMHQVRSGSVSAANAIQTA